MKTRSNMPLFVVECTDIKALSNTQIDQLRCGDYLVKISNGQEHAYKVTYKKEGEGMCLTYADASVVETVSYDWNNSTKKWVYNSTDVAPISPDAIEERVTDLIEGGTIENAKPVCFHPIYCRVEDGSFSSRLCFFILDNYNQPYDDAGWKAKAKQLMDNGASLQVNGYIKDKATDKVVYAYLAQKVDSNYLVYGNDSAGSPTAYDFDLVATLNSDGENKIN